MNNYYEQLSPKETIPFLKYLKHYANCMQEKFEYICNSEDYRTINEQINYFVYTENYIIDKILVRQIGKAINHKDYQNVTDTFCTIFDSMISYTIWQDKQIHLKIVKSNFATLQLQLDLSIDYYTNII